MRASLTSPSAGPTWLGKAQTHLMVSCLHTALDRCPWVPIMLRSAHALLGAMLFEIYKFAIGWPSAGRCTRMRRSGCRARMSYVCVCCRVLGRSGRCAHMCIPAYATGVARTAARVLSQHVQLRCEVSREGCKTRKCPYPQARGVAGVSSPPH